MSTLPGKRRSNIVRLAIGSMVSTAGDEMAYLALSWVIYRKTGSAIWLSASLILTMGVSGLFSLVAGPVADRFDRKRILIIGELAASVCFLLMVFTEAPAMLLLLAFLASCAATFVWPAQSASIPNLANESDLEWANGWMSAAHNVSHLIGPFAMGALLTVIPADWMFAFNAVTFLIAAALVWTIRASFQDMEARARAEPTGPLEGFRVIGMNKILLSVTVAWFLVTIAINMVIVTDIPLTDLFHAGSIGYGLLYGMFGGGAVIGALIATRLKPRSYWWALMLETVVTAIGYLMVSVAPWFAIPVIVVGAVGMADAMGTVAGTSLVQRTADDAVRGRVFAAFGTVWPVANIFGFLVAGPMLQAWGPKPVYAFGGVVAIISTIAIWPAVRTLRAMRDDPQSSDSSEEPDALGLTQLRDNCR